MPPTESLIQELIKKLDGENVVGLLLTGSYAREDATRYSDVDILRFLENKTDIPERSYMLHMFGDKLISLSDTTVASKRVQLKTPAHCFYAVPGIRQSQILLDKRNELKKLKQDADDFNWDSIADASDEYSSYLLMGCAEGVAKILGGFTRNDWSSVFAGSLEIILTLPVALAVVNRLLFESENDFYQGVIAAAGVDSDWSRTLRSCAGIENQSCTNDVVTARGIGSLDLYMLTERLLRPVIRAKHEEVIAHAVKTIRDFRILAENEQSFTNMIRI